MGIQGWIKGKKYIPEGLVFLFFLLVLLAQRHHDLNPLYAPFSIDEASQGFMQFYYYLHALRGDDSLYWDHYVYLATQGAPTSPLLSFVTWVMILLATLMNLTEMASLATLFALTCYVLLALAGLNMYLFLRFLTLSRLAAVLGGIIYTHNPFVMTFTINHGIYRTTAYMLFPLIVILFIKLFGTSGNRLRMTAITGLVLGLCYIANGDVKPIHHFMPLLLILAFFEGHQTLGFGRTLAYLGLVVLIALAIASPQLVPTYEWYQLTLKSELRSYAPLSPLFSDNYILGFSQSPFSLLMGSLFPETFFEFFKMDLFFGQGLKIWEQKIFLVAPALILGFAGFYYETPHHKLWVMVFILYITYLLGSNTPLSEVYGYLSAKTGLRYPTRASFMLYFLLGIYAAYGWDVVVARKSEYFHEEGWKKLLFNSGLFIFVLGLVFLVCRVLLQDAEPLLTIPTLIYLCKALPAILIGLIFIKLIQLAWKPGRNPKNHPVTFHSAGLILLFGFLFLLFLIFGFTKVNFSAPKVLSEIEGFFAWSLFGVLSVVLLLKLKDKPYHKSLAVVLMAGCVFAQQQAGNPGPLVPEKFYSDPERIFQRDQEFLPLFQTKGYERYRLLISDAMKFSLSPELGFSKSVHTYCCTQNEDKLRIGFGVDFPPKGQSALSRLTTQNYENYFLRLYNVKYIYDEFGKRPDLLPRDPETYTRLSENLIMLNATREVLYFMDDFEVKPEEEFFSRHVKSNDPLLKTRAFLSQDRPYFTKSTATSASPEIQTTHYSSGKIQARVSTENPGFLVYSEQWMPSWVVYVDGVKKENHRVDGMLQGVWLEPGDHDVGFEFEVLSTTKMKVAVGAALAALALVGVLSLSGRRSQPITDPGKMA